MEVIILIIWDLKLVFKILDFINLSVTASMCETSAIHKEMYDQKVLLDPEFLEVKNVPISVDF